MQYRLIVIFFFEQQRINGMMCASSKCGCSCFTLEVAIQALEIVFEVMFGISWAYSAS